MRAGGTVGDTLRHTVGLGPDDVRAQIPSVSLECERHAPWDANEVFWFQPRWIGFALAYCKAWHTSILSHSVLARVCVATAPFIAVVVRISQVQPKRAVIAQHAPHLREHLPHGFDVGLGRFFKADLIGVSVVAQSPIRRTRYHTLHRLWLKLLEHCPAISIDNSQQAHSYKFFTSPLFKARCVMAILESIPNFSLALVTWHSAVFIFIPSRSPICFTGTSLTINLMTSNSLRVSTWNGAGTISTSKEVSSAATTGS